MGDPLSVCKGQSDYELAPTSIPAREEPRFAGRWLTSKGNVHLIGLEAIQWSNGETSLLSTQKRYGSHPECQTELKGKRYTAELRPNGTLVWNDGDVWTRDTRVPGTRTYEALAQAGASFQDSYVSPFTKYVDEMASAPNSPGTWSDMKDSERRRRAVCGGDEDEAGDWPSDLRGSKAPSTMPNVLSSVAAQALAGRSLPQLPGVKALSSPRTEPMAFGEVAPRPKRKAMPKL
mmetsp:Transcript_6009/g.14329  ORF Transcript_6009/g.14329 Transcript_6009/m.14329 type:complete len:233 (+) Transcript_6009:62-760(+)